MWLSVFSFQDERPLPADVVAADGATVRLAFRALDVEEEAHLVRTIFSRADAWLGHADVYRPDNPLRTVAAIAWHGLAGAARIAATAAPRRAPRAARPRAPVAVGSRS